MKHFQEEYRQAVNEELPEFHMDIREVQDELHHRRMRMQQRRRLVTKGCTAAAAFFLLGVSTAAAKSYRNAAIELRNSGYVISGSEKGAGNAGTDSRPENNAGLMAIRSMQEEDGAAYAGGVPDAEADVVELGDDCVEEIEIQEWEYESLDDFRGTSSQAAKIPDLSLLAAQYQKEHVWVMEDDMTICLRVTEDNRSFCLRQTDYRNAAGFSAATTYGGENANERNLTNAQGLNYIVFDTVGENGVVESTHAVIVVEGRELSLDFMGFEPETIEEILTEMNLDLYFR